MALVGKETDTREIPGEPGQTMTFRLLSGSELEEAERKATRGVIEMMQGIDLSGVPAPRDVDEGERRRTAHDADTLVRYGVTAWTYPDPCDDEHKAKLVAKTRDWARDVVLEMNVRTEAEKKASTERSSSGASLPSSVRSTD